jgi:hypothetical protein
MGKRSDFPKLKLDDTPPKPVLSLLTLLQPGTKFFEPCAGKGGVVGHLSRAGLVCVGASDIKPRGRGIERRCALTLTAADVPPGTTIITNPPHTVEPLHPLIAHFVTLAPTWLLLKADWKENEHAAPFVKKWLKLYLPFGRVLWIPNTNNTGMENFGWHLFESGRGVARLLPRVHHNDLPKLEN